MDECIVQPVSLPLFLAKVHAWLRRTQSLPTSAVDALQGGGREAQLARPIRAHEDLAGVGCGIGD